MLSALQLQSGEPKRAIEVLDRMVKADPENLTALNMLGVAKAAQGDRAEPEDLRAGSRQGCGLSGCGPQSRSPRSRRGQDGPARQRLNRVLQSVRAMSMR